MIPYPSNQDDLSDSIKDYVQINTDILPNQVDYALSHINNPILLSVHGYQDAMERDGELIDLIDGVHDENLLGDRVKLLTKVENVMDITLAEVKNLIDSYGDRKQ